MADEAVDGLLVTDTSGRVIYANAAYMALTDAAGADDVRPVERAFVGDPGPVGGGLSAGEGGARGTGAPRRRCGLPAPGRATNARWLRLRVRPLGEGNGRTLWTITDVTRDHERQENIFQEFQHAIDYLDHAPAGFFSADADGRARLSQCHARRLARPRSGARRLRRAQALRHRLRQWRIAPDRARGGARRGPTEVVDLDFKTRGGRSVPVRLFHQVAFGADGTPGPSRTLVLNRSRGEASDPERAAEVRFMRFFQSTPMGIATVDKAGRIAAAMRCSRACSRTR